LFGAKKVVDFTTSKILAGFGSIMLFLAFTGAVFSRYFGAFGFLAFDPVSLVFGVIGVVFVLIGMNGLSDYYKEDKICGRVLIGVPFGVIGFVFLAIFPVILGVAHVFMLLMSWYFIVPFYSLADRSGKRLFRITGKMLRVCVILLLVYLICNVLAFILLIGPLLIALLLLNIFCLVLVGITFLTLAIAFFSLNVNTTTQLYNQTAQKRVLTYINT
jgi:uncharacterized membrane protein